MVYPGRRATWRYFSGVPCCHVRNILIFILMVAQTFQKYQWRTSLWRFTYCAQWSGLAYLCNSVVILQVQQEKLVVPTSTTSHFWRIRWRDRRLSPLLRHKISLFFDMYQTDLFEIRGPHIPSQIYEDFYILLWCTRGTLEVLRVAGVPRVPEVSKVPEIN